MAQTLQEKRESQRRAQAKYRASVKGMKTNARYEGTQARKDSRARTELKTKLKKLAKLAKLSESSSCT